MRLQAVYLEWDDSEFHDTGWAAYDPRRKSMLVKTMGWLVGENARELTIASSCDMGEPPQWGAQFSIPKSAIRKRRRVTLP